MRRRALVVPSALLPLFASLTLSGLLSDWDRYPILNLTFDEITR